MALRCLASHLLGPSRGLVATRAAPTLHARWFSTGTGTEDEERRKMVNRLLYRSKQRGFLELDLLVGLWAEQHIPSMSLEMLQQFSEILHEENPDLFKWLTHQQPAPERLTSNPAYQALSEHVAQQMAEHAHQATHAPPGAEWVRGWHDTGKGQEEQQQAAQA